MSLDDLLGLLFLLFFIVIPALRGLSRRGQPPPCLLYTSDAADE